ncbi:MAG: lytic transglycosylase domain-containing protein, partial [Dehalococcoidia bacterium]
GASAEAGLADVSIDAALTLLQPFTGDQRLGAPRELLRLAYPLPYANELTRAAELETVPPLLLAAIVRQESRFDPLAGSSAGANGLTQVVGPTGEAIAASLGRPWNPADLARPSVSLRYGAHYLSAQLDAFEGNVFAALAAYNGGPGNASRWLDAQRWPGADGFIEAVDFNETRHYLEIVLENYGWYRYLYAAIPTPAIR